MMKHRSAPSYEIISCNLHLKGDLERWDYPYFDYVMTLYNQYSKHGVLPHSGCHSEQPAKLLEIFDILETLSMEREEKARREAEQQAKRKNNGRR